MQHASPRWPYPVAALTLVGFLVACLYYPDARADPSFVLIFGAIVAAFVVVGALLTSRVRGNAIGPLLLGSGVALVVTIAAGSIAVVALENGNPPVELVAIALLVNDLGFILPIGTVLIVLPQLFPDGRLLSPRWGWILVVVFSGLAAVALATVLMPGPINESDLQNPFAVPGLEGLASFLGSYANWSSIVGFGGALLALVIRYRRGDGVQRQQVKWLVAVASVAAVAFPVAFLLPVSTAADAAFLIGLLALFALPIAIAVAVLRYRLYEIDRIISRTIGWALVTGLILTAFAVLVVGLQALLANQTQTQSQTLAVAASTVVAFALFQPLRRRVQRAVDRRFDRARYDAQRTADAFAERLRDEVELDALTRELERTVAEAIRPTTATLWLPGRDAAR